MKSVRETNREANREANIKRLGYEGYNCDQLANAAFKMVQYVTCFLVFCSVNWNKIN